jgi:hypothetical protein
MQRFSSVTGMHAEPLAIRTKLASAQEINTQNEFRPEEAQKVIPGLEICWASIPIHRPDGSHRHGGCSCPSRSEFSEFPATGSIETIQQQ